MYQEERMIYILEYINKNKRISVDKICSLCDVSRDTARRDLVSLEKKGSIIRTHGGAILPKNHLQIKGYTDRLQHSSEEKKLIGKMAASLIKDGDVIIMDTSTTIQAAAEMMTANNCTVITNCINLADVLSKHIKISIHLLGGKLNHEHRFLYGPNTISMLSNYHADKVFIGALGISENGISVDDDEDAFTKRKMIEQSEQVIVVADHSKFGKDGFFKVSDLKNIDLIITDKLPDKKFLNLFTKNNINIMLAK